MKLVFLAISYIDKVEKEKSVLLTLTWSYQVSRPRGYFRSIHWRLNLDRHGKSVWMRLKCSVRLDCWSRSPVLCQRSSKSFAPVRFFLTMNPASSLASQVLFFCSDSILESFLRGNQGREYCDRYWFLFLWRILIDRLLITDDCNSCIDEDNEIVASFENLHYFQLEIKQYSIDTFSLTTNRPSMNAWR